MNNITFGKARIEDALRISIVLKTVYIEVYAIDGVTIESANFIEKRFSIEHIKKIILNNPEQLLIAYCNDNPVGVAELIFDALCPIRKIAVPELDKLYVLKRFNSQGVGQGLMIEAEKLLKHKKFNEIFLDVYIENERAISFYEKYGFRKIGQVDFPMEHNTYKNWVMTKEI